MGRQRRSGGRGKPGTIGLILATGLLLAGVPGLMPVSAGAQAAAATGDPSGSLQGRWRVEFQLEISDEHTVPSARQASGEIAFDSSRWWGQSARFGR